MDRRCYREVGQGTIETIFAFLIAVSVKYLKFLALLRISVQQKREYYYLTFSESEGFHLKYNKFCPYFKKNSIENTLRSPYKILVI